jgi:hypothetical protein
MTNPASLVVTQAVTIVNELSSTVPFKTPIWHCGSVLPSLRLLPRSSEILPLPSRSGKASRYLRYRRSSAHNAPQPLRHRIAVQYHLEGLCLIRVIGALRPFVELSSAAGADGICFLKAAFPSSRTLWTAWLPRAKPRRLRQAPRTLSCLPFLFVLPSERTSTQL